MAPLDIDVVAGGGIRALFVAHWMYCSFEDVLDFPCGWREDYGRL